MNTSGRLIAWLQSPKQRREALSFASGALIALGLAARYLAGLPAVFDTTMIAAALIAGSDIAVRAWNALRRRTFSIELLVTIATLGALVIGEYWEAAAVTFLFIFGAFLEAQTLSRTRKTIAGLLDLAPLTALVLRDGRQVEVTPQDVQLGETVLLKPGARVPVDGEVTGGHSVVDESAITGEPIPEEKTSGDRVYAGTINQDGALTVHATGVGADTTLARIIRRVEEAQEEKAPTQRLIERFARWYTPLIIALSALSFLITRDIRLALTLLVIGCPGALVISTPVSVIAGIGSAARKGILIKGGEYLENAGKISAVALDKTGTLTQGKPRLTDIIVLHDAPVQAIPVLAGAAAAQAGAPRASGRWDARQRDVLRWASIAESSSEHPLARPILAEMAPLERIPQPDSFETLTGKGVRAIHQDHRIAVGTPGWMREVGVVVSPDAELRLKELKESGKTAMLVAIDGVALGILGIADTLRENAAEALQSLRRAGVRKVVMLTGDDRLTAEAIAREAGIDEVRAGLLPEGKLDAIRELQREGHVVAMAGDGINDAPALAAADISMAMGAAGTGIAIETADIALMADDLAKIPEAILLSKATSRNIRQNVVIALLTVTGLLAGVLVGEVNMAGGMLIHQASVLVVIFNGMRLMKR